MLFLVVISFWCFAPVKSLAGEIVSEVMCQMRCYTPTQLHSAHGHRDQFFALQHSLSAGSTIGGILWYQQQTLEDTQ